MIEFQRSRKLIRATTVANKKDKGHLMFWGFILLIVTILHFRDTIRKSNRPELLKEDFMWENGYTHSLIAIRYFFGKPEEGRAAIANDPQIRQKYVTERLIFDIIGFVFGLILIVRPLCLLLWNTNL